MKPQLPSFSIIIPTHSRPAQLVSCLNAIARLDYPRECFEVVVVDDGSPAPPEDVIASFRARIEVKLLVQQRGGPAAARNTGAACAMGEFLVFTDDDCMPERNWLRAFAARFLATPERLVGGRTLNALPENLYSATSQAIIDVVYEHFNTGDGALFFASNNFAVPAKGFHKVGGFDETFITSEDREFCDRWAHQGYCMTYAPEVLNYHAHPLTFRTLWHQHFGYGRGAFRFHRARRLRDGARIEPDPRFYFKLLSYPSCTEKGRRALVLTALVCWTQLASSAGFVREIVTRDGLSKESAAH
jgi:GT2 family glycosyltransferase